MKKNLVKIALTAAAFLASAYPAFADVAVPISPPGGVANITIPGIIQLIIRLLIVVAFVIAFIILLIGGIRWMTSGGDPKNVEGARNMVTAGLVGLVIVLAAFALIRLVETIFGLSLGFGGGELTIPIIGGGSQ